MLTEINELIAEKEIEVNGITVKLNVIAGGDMKFMLIIFGLNAANSKYACIWCEIQKDERFLKNTSANYNLIM